MTTIDIEVVYALKDDQTIAAIQLAAGATVREAVVCSGILALHPELTLDRCEVAVWGKITDQESVLRHGDRVEICRALLDDPKIVRRKLAGKKR